MTFESNYAIATAARSHWLKNCESVFSQWEAKLRPITTHTCDLSRALSKLQVIARNSDSLIALFGPAVFGRSNYFGICFSTVILKTAQINAQCGLKIVLVRTVVSVSTGSFKKWRRQRQRQRHKSMIWLVEWGKITVLHVRHAFPCNFMIWSAKGHETIFEILTTTRHRTEPKIFHSLPLQENHSCQASESALRLFCTTWPTWNGRKTLNLTQISLLMWRFRCSRRRGILKSLFGKNFLW